MRAQGRAKPMGRRGPPPGPSEHRARGRFRAVSQRVITCTMRTISGVQTQSKCENCMTYCLPHGDSESPETERAFVPFCTSPSQGPTGYFHQTRERRQPVTQERLSSTAPDTTDHTLSRAPFSQHVLTCVRHATEKCVLCVSGHINSLRIEAQATRSRPH